MVEKINEVRKEKYNLEAKLGHGDMAKEVFKVRGKESGKSFAVKRFRTDMLSEEQKTELSKVSKYMQAFDHPNVIKVERPFKSKDGYRNLVVEFADAGNLSDLIEQRTKQGHPFSEAELVNYISQICKAVSYV